MNEVVALADRVDIEAPVERVWVLVSDLTRMPDWSPQVTSVRVKGDAALGLGSRFTNRNRLDELEWTTHGEVVRFDPLREVAFRIEENYVIWSFRLESLGDGRTRLSQRRETPEGISDLSVELTDGFMGGQEVFTEVMRTGMTQTLERIRSAAEQ